MDNTYKLTHKLLVLELENKVLKNKISEMETEKSRDVSFTLPKTKTE